MRIYSSHIMCTWQNKNGGWTSQVVDATVIMQTGKIDLELGPFFVPKI